MDGVFKDGPNPLENGHASGGYRVWYSGLGVYVPCGISAQNLGGYQIQSAACGNEKLTSGNFKVDCPFTPVGSFSSRTNQMHIEVNSGCTEVVFNEGDSLGSPDACSVKGQIICLMGPKSYDKAVSTAEENAQILVANHGANVPLTLANLLLHRCGPDCSPASIVQPTPLFHSEDKLLHSLSDAMSIGYILPVHFDTHGIIKYAIYATDVARFALDIEGICPELSICVPQRSSGAVGEYESPVAYLYSGAPFRTAQGEVFPPLTVVNFLFGLNALSKLRKNFDPSGDGIIRPRSPLISPVIHYNVKSGRPPYIALMGGSSRSIKLFSFVAWFHYISLTNIALHMNDLLNRTWKIGSYVTENHHLTSSEKAAWQAPEDEWLGKSNTRFTITAPRVDVVAYARIRCALVSNTLSKDSEMMSALKHAGKITVRFRVGDTYHFANQYRRSSPEIRSLGFLNIDFELPAFIVINNELPNCVYVPFGYVGGTVFPRHTMYYGEPLLGLHVPGMPDVGLGSSPGTLIELHTE